MPDHRLFFSRRPAIAPNGRCLTVRMGKGWAKRLAAGDEVEIWGVAYGGTLATETTKEKVKFYDARVLDVYTRNLGDVTMLELSYLSEPDCRTAEDLVDAMQEYYSDPSFNTRSKASLVFFEPIPEEGP